MHYLFLGSAVVFEVIGTMLMPATKSFTKLWPTLGMAISYMIAFYLLTLSLRTLPIAVVYASWSGLGVFLIAILGFIFFGQSLNWQSILGLVLIVAGVVLVNMHVSAH